MPRKKRIPPCPDCSSRNVVPIVYGLPSADAWEKMEKGEIGIGGCCIFTDEDGNMLNPEWVCKDCGCEFPKREGYPPPEFE